jgi:galactokinase
VIPKLLAAFARQFGKAGGAPRLFFAPGRVNLIGEHTDYNGGHVFPCALTLGTYCAARVRPDRALRFYSLNFPDAGVIETDLDRAEPLPGGSWANYPLGVLRAFAAAGHAIDRGLDLAFCGDIPAGAGLSSSAAIEVATGTALRALFGLPLSGVDVALLGQRAENEFVGLSCGIMDQFASAMGKRENAIFLDTETLEYQYAPLRLNGARILIVNSMVKHALAGSAYNDRRSECARALEALRREKPGLPSLGALTPAEFDAISDAIPDETCRRRARHAVYENARTLAAFDALRSGDLAAFGRLMNESHVSLRDDYAVSCGEVDALAELAWATPGVYGARITGGGFGGCTVNIVADAAAAEFTETVQREYARKTGLNAEVYTVFPWDGAHEITKETDRCCTTPSTP